MGSGRAVHDANTCMQLYLRRAVGSNTHKKSYGREFVQVQSKACMETAAFQQGNLQSGLVYRRQSVTVLEHLRSCEA